MVRAIVPILMEAFLADYVLVERAAYLTDVSA